MSRGERVTTLVIGILGLILMGIQAWDVLDRRGAVSASIAVSLWVLSTAMVTYAAYRNLKDVHRAKSLLAQIQTLKEEFELQTEAAEKKHTEALKNVKLSLSGPKIEQPPKAKQWDAPFHDNATGLRIESAIYGSPGKTRDVTDRVRSKLPTGWGEIIVRHNDLCDDDPSENVYKFLTVTFSVTQGQDRILAIPELPASSALSINQVKAATTTAPQLLVEYRPVIQEPLEDEHLIFINDGPGTVQDIKVGPMLWTLTHRREINIHSVLGPLREQQHVDCKFAVYEQKEKLQHIKRLTAMLRDMMREDGEQIEPSVRISYKDTNGRRYYRTFILAIDPYDRVVWNPNSPARHEHDEAAGL